MPGKGRPGGRGKSVFQLLAVSVLLVGGVAFYVLRNDPFGAPNGRGRSPSARATYVGSQACHECHPSESAQFARSGHSQTLRPAAQVPLAKKLNGKTITDPEHADVKWTYELSGDTFQIKRLAAREDVQAFVIEYAFGSDHNATTFVNLDGPKNPHALEHRLTHYAKGDRFEITPGQSAGKPYPGTNSHGRELPDWEALRCFRCHATRVSTASPDVLHKDELIPNVSCERCHGPGSTHIAAARSGSAVAALSMPFGNNRWTAESQMTLCGKCHRHPSEANPGRIRPDVIELTRFQPIGLMQSRCYTESDGSFSCVTCHEPHSRASTDLASYDRTCLNCHASTLETPCPVSPKTNCVSCHMPRVDSGQNILFTDHWIRVRKKESR